MLRIFFFTALFLTLTACEVDSNAPSVDTVYPQPVAQGAPLTFYGQHFGDFQNGNRVLFGGTCANIEVWEPGVIRVTVPTGIGVGLRPLRVEWESGESVELLIEVSGDELPARPQDSTCRPGLVTASPEDVSSDTGAMDGGGSDIAP